MSVNTTSLQELREAAMINQFCNTTGCSHAEARQFLERAKWQYEAAISEFYGFVSPNNAGSASSSGMHSSNGSNQGSAVFSSLENYNISGSEYEGAMSGSTSSGKMSCRGSNSKLCVVGGVVPTTPANTPVTPPAFPVCVTGLGQMNVTSSGNN
eukprot:Nk52_evm44s1810 gene=Nk52_evmTU44s1810